MLELSIKNMVMCRCFDEIYLKIGFSNNGERMFVYNTESMITTEVPFGVKYIGNGWFMIDFTYDGIDFHECTMDIWWNDIIREKVFLPVYQNEKKPIPPVKKSQLIIENIQEHGRAGLIMFNLTSGDLKRETLLNGSRYKNGFNPYFWDGETCQGILWWYENNKGIGDYYLSYYCSDGSIHNGKITVGTLEQLIIDDEIELYYQPSHFHDSSVRFLCRSIEKVKTEGVNSSSIYFHERSNSHARGNLDLTCSCVSDELGVVEVVAMGRGWYKRGEKIPTYDKDREVLGYYPIF